MAVPASAAETVYDLADYYDGYSVYDDGQTKSVCYDLPYAPSLTAPIPAQVGTAQESMSFTVTAASGTGMAIYYPFGLAYLDITDLKTGSVVDVLLNVPIEYTGDADSTTALQTLNYTLQVYAYDADFSSLGRIGYVSATLEEANDGTTYITPKDNWSIDIPDDCQYIQIQCNLGGSFTAGTYTFHAHEATLWADVNMLAENSDTLNQIENQLGQIITGDPEDQGAVDDFQQDMDSITPGIQEDLDQMGQVTQPDVSDIDTDLGSLVGEEGVEHGVSVLSMLTGWSLIGTQILIACTIIIMAFVLFGKRG